MMRAIPAGLHLWPARPQRQPGLGDLEGRTHPSDLGRALTHVFAITDCQLLGTKQKYYRLTADSSWPMCFSWSYISCTVCEAMED